MKKQWVIPDIHGCATTLKCLVEELIRPEPQDEIYLLGDYIDRGPDSKGVIDYIRSLQNAGYLIFPLKGNHEDILVELFDAEMEARTPWFFHFISRKRKIWHSIGGKETLASFHIRHVTEIPSEYIEWMRGLDYFVRLEKFILVHAGLNFRKEDPFEDKHAMLWVRDYEIKPEKIDYCRIIHGHVPVHLEMISLAIRNSYYKFIDLDNGAYIQGQTGFGNLVALELNTMELAIMDNREKL